MMSILRFFEGLKSILPLIIVIFINASVAGFLGRIQAFVKTHSTNKKNQRSPKIALNKPNYLNDIQIMTLKGK